MSDSLISRYGTAEKPPIPTVLQSGNISLKLVNGELKEIRYRGVEILRAVAYVVRDENWGTYHQDITHRAMVVQQDQRLLLKLQSVCYSRQGDNWLTMEAIIHVDPQGIDFTVHATPEKDFVTARCGFSVLYPLQGVTGSPVRVIHTDGGDESACFPVLIAPWQPFKDIASLVYDSPAGIRVATHYQGDIFEMEDQRAWSDGSYKVYSRPLEKPWPYTLKAGNTFTQQIRLQVSDYGDKAISPPTTPCAIADRVPALGILLTGEQLYADGNLADELCKLAIQYVIFHFNPRQDGIDLLVKLAALMHALAQQSYQPALHIEFVLPVEKGADIAPTLHQFWHQLREVALVPTAIIVSPETDLTSTPPGSQWPWCPSLSEIYQAARAAFPGMALGGGMFSYFTELNRKRPPVDLIDFVTHSTCPIVHAADDNAVMQTLESLPYITRTTRSFIGPKTPYHIGPSMISMRHNPYGAGVYANPQQIRMTMTNQDPRQRGLFFASWLVGYLASLSGAAVTHWTPAALIGPLGLSNHDARQVDYYPAWHVVALLATLSGWYFDSAIDDNGKVMLYLRERQTSDNTRWIMANTHHEEINITLPEEATEQFFLLDMSGCDTTPQNIDRQTITLNSYAVIGVRKSPIT